MIDFPLFERDEETGNWTFLHHPFTAPIAGHEERVAGDPGSALSQHYDLIWNGWELGSGSIRIHRPDVQQRRLPDDGDERRGGARRSSAFLLDALAMGAPPHGGFAIGIERFVALMAGEPNIRAGDRLPEGLERLRSADRRAVRGRRRAARELGIRLVDEPPA